MSYVQMSAVRVQGGEERAAMRRFAPLTNDHPAVRDDGECVICGNQFVVGAVVTIVPLGPGDDPEAQEKARRGGWYSCHGVITHASCAGVPEDPEVSDA